MSDHKADIRFMPDAYAAEVESLPIVMHAILWVSVAFVVVAVILSLIHI